MKDLPETMTAKWDVAVMDEAGETVLAGLPVTLPLARAERLIARGFLREIIEETGTDKGK